MFTQNENLFMQRALDLAEKGFRETWPNPMVGAVIVKKGKIIGEGWHRRCGGHHAEVEAIKDAKCNVAGATIYLNLEPCAHFGKTPPCVQALIDYGIKRVVCSMRDPNPKVSGKGFAKLRSAGIRVDVGLMKKEAEELNRVFIKLITSSYPYVVNKMALSIDGKIACENGRSKWISSKTGRRYAHYLRTIADAVLVGSKTVIEDDPELNIRLISNPKNHQPLRIVLEGKHRIPKRLKMYRTKDQQKIIIVSTRDDKQQKKTLSGIERWVLPGSNNRVNLSILLKRLRQKGVHFLLVEGGADVHAAFLGVGDSGNKLLTDEIHMILAPKLIGGRNALGPIGGKGVGNPNQAIEFNEMHWRILGDDLLVIGRPRCKRMKGK